MKWVLYLWDEREWTWYVIRGERAISPRTRTIAVFGRVGRVFKWVKRRKKNMTGSDIRGIRIIGRIVYMREGDG
jgi:hypothetical protein